MDGDGGSPLAGAQAAVADVWPPAPFAAAVRLDGRWIPGRPAVATLLVAAAIWVCVGAPAPVVGELAVPALSITLLVAVVAIGLVDATAGLAAAVLGVTAATVATQAPVDARGLGSLALQVLVVASLSCLIALAVTEIARELWRITLARLPRLPRAVDAIGAGLLAAAVAWFTVSGWIAASPVMYASAVPGATYAELALPDDVATAVTVAMAVAGLRAGVTRLRRPTLRVLPVATGWWAIGGQLAGGTMLLLLLSSLFHGAVTELVLAAVLVGASRLVRSGVAPEPRRLLGAPVAGTLARIPPFGQMLLIVVPALGIASTAGDDVGSVRVSFLVCLAIVLLFAERGPAPFPARGSASSEAAVAAPDA